MKEISGVITACITPFCDQGVDYAGLEKNLEDQVRSGVDAVLILGTTGEAFSLTKEERVKIIETTISVINRRIPVWVGTGTNCTRSTIEQTLEAEELGADVALVVTPYYNRPPQDGIVKHIHALHEETDLPICLYDVPKRTGTVMEVSTILKLAKLERVVALKDATGDISRLQQIIFSLGDSSSLKILSGDDALTFPMVIMGANGVVSVASNVLPEEMVKLVKAARKLDVEGARQLHYLLLPLFNALFVEPNPIAVKAAMNLRGQSVGWCRSPLTEISENGLSVLKSQLSKYEYLETRKR